MRDVVAAALRRAPVQPLAKWVWRSSLRVLAYHAISDRQSFERQLDYVAEHYQPVSLEQVMAAWGHGRLPSGAVLLTFDDGHRSWVDLAAPAMRRRGIPGVAFVVAGAVGSSTPYWWDEVAALRQADGTVAIRELKTVPDDERVRALEEMRSAASELPSTGAHLSAEDLFTLEDSGLEVGSHTLTHPLLDRCDHEKVVSEVRGAKHRLEEILGHSVRSFAYPNGNFNNTVADTVREAGHDVAFLFDHGPAAWPIRDAMAVSRIRVNAHDPLDTFAVRISGLHPAIHRLRGKR